MSNELAKDLIGSAHSVIDSLLEEMNNGPDKLAEFYDFLDHSSHVITSNVKRSIHMVDLNDESHPMMVLTCLLAVRSYFEFRNKQPRMNDELLVDLVIGSMREKMVDVLSRSAVIVDAAPQEDANEQQTAEG